MAWYIFLLRRLWNIFRNVFQFLLNNMEIVGERIAMESSIILINVTIIQ